MPNDGAKLTRDSGGTLNNPYPSNSETKPRPPEKKVEPIVKGKVWKQKRGWMQKMKESICGNEDQSVGDYILYDILIPAAKSTISDMISGGVELLLFGERRHRPRDIRRDGSKSYVSYTSYYNPSENTARPARQEASSNRHNFEEVIFASRGEAEDVLSHMAEMIDEYGLVSVGDFYDLCNVPSVYTDQRYGWTSLREAFTERVRDGYIIRLPRVKPLN